MENQPYNNRSEGSKDKGDGKKESGEFGYTNVYQTPQERPTYEAPTQAERHIPLAPAFEGIISWRDDLSVEQPASEKHSEKDAKDKEEKDKGKKEGEKRPTTPREVSEQPNPSLFSELQQAEQTSEDEANTEDEDKPADIPDAPQPAVPANPDRYPQYANAYETEADGQPDIPTPPQPVPLPYNNTDRLVSVEQAVYGPRPANQAEFVAAEPAYTTEAQDQEPEIPAPAMPIPPAATAFMRPASEQSQQWTPPAETAPFAAVPEQQQDANSQPAEYQQEARTPWPEESPTYSPLQPETAPAYDPGHDPYLNPRQGSEYGASAAPAMPIEHPTFAYTNRDPRVGPVAALLGLEYIGRKRADRKLERKMNKQIESTAKEQQQRTTAEYQRVQEQQRQFATEQQWQSAELRRTQQTPAPAQERYTAPTATPAMYETPGQFQPQSFETPRSIQAASSVSVEQQRQQPRTMNPETRPAVPASAVAAEQQSQDAAEQPLELKPNQHVEHSAWHNIVVDERGHEVAGAINYGEGFQRERQQELRQEPPADQGGTTAGSMAQGQAPQFGMPYPGALPSGMTAPSLPRGHATHADTQHQLEAQNKKQTANINSPWFWIMILLIVAAFFTAAAI